MAIKPEYALTEFYVSLVTYTVMHMIFVISSDFVDAFNIPPLNIGIYVDKLAAIRALLMVIADILEWGITQKGCSDPGMIHKLFDSKSSRRQGSVLSFFIMWACRCHYIWILYFSNNKSLLAFINLSVEGFWFGVFQMSFFAIGPEYNAFTSLAIHTMGNFIFFTQLILNKLSLSYPWINCLSRVRVHAWICLVISTISLGPWVWFCQDYIKGDTNQYRELVEELVAVCGDPANTDAATIATQFANAVQEGAPKFKALVTALTTPLGDSLTAGTLQSAINSLQTRIKPLVKTIESVNRSLVDSAEISATASGNTTVTVKVKKDTGEEDSNLQTGVSVTVKGDEIFNLEVKFSSELTTGGDTADKKVKAKEVADKLARRLAKAAEKAKASSIYNPGKALVKAEFDANVQSVTANTSGSSTTVTVQIGTSATTERGTATVTVVKEGTGSSATVTIEVMSVNESDISKAAGRRMARRLAKAMIDFQVSMSLKSGIKTEFSQKIEQEHVWSPFLLFIVGAFAEDFSVPGILPFALLDTERAALVNYLTPLFFFTGAFITLLLNDIFSAEQSLFGTSMKDIDWQFKEWSEGEGHPWHALWSLNLFKYTAFFIAMWCIHGTYGRLRCIVQSRWRVMLLTMFIVIPRAWLETAGYVGVANFAIAQGEAGDFSGFDFIAFHDMVAMFCRFVYGKFAVGYNWT